MKLTWVATILITSLFVGRAADAQNGFRPELTVAGFSMGEIESAPIFQFSINLNEKQSPEIRWVSLSGICQKPFAIKDVNWSRKQLNEARQDIAEQLTKKPALSHASADITPIDLLVHFSLKRGTRMEQKIIKTDIGTLMRFFAKLDSMATDWSELIRRSLEVLPESELMEVRQWEALDVKELEVIHVLTDEESVKFVPSE